MEAIQKHRKRYRSRYRYKYIIKPRIEEIEKIKNSLIGYRLYDIKIKIGMKIKYFNFDDEISFLSAFENSKEDIVCSIRLIKDEEEYYILKEKLIDFDLIKEEIGEE